MNIIVYFKYHWYHSSNHGTAMVYLYKFKKKKHICQAITRQTLAYHSCCTFLWTHQGHCSPLKAKIKTLISCHIWSVFCVLLELDFEFKTMHDNKVIKSKANVVKAIPVHTDLRKWQKKGCIMNTRTFNWLCHFVNFWAHNACVKI